jgi:hypothetical protein
MINFDLFILKIIGIPTTNDYCLIFESFLVKIH